MTAQRSAISRLAGWMAQNAIAANMLMVALLAGGYFALQIVEQEAQASFTLNKVEVSVEYPGASPEEVEESILLGIESNLQGISSIRKMVATAEEGYGHVLAELAEGANPNVALQDIKIAVDRIRTFPIGAERPEVRLAEDIEDIVALALYGNVDEQTLYMVAKDIQADLLTIPDITRVDIVGARRPEILMEVPAAELRARGLTLAELADSVANTAQDVPAGAIRGSDGETLLRILGKRDKAERFSELSAVASPAGLVSLSDIAKVSEGFEDTDRILTFDNQRGYELVVFQSEKGRILELSEQVYSYVSERQKSLPTGMYINVLDSQADSFRDRIGLLYENGAMGLLLVVVALALFMEIRLAFWVSASIPVVFLGAVTFMPAAAVPLNMVTLFAFIITLGIVVDDAVIVGENIYRHLQAGKPVQESVMDGVEEMLVPVTFAVGTNIMAFLPSMFLPGEIGQMLKPMAMLVFAIFIVSFIEAIFILPAHLMGMKGEIRQFRALKEGSLLATVVHPLARIRAHVAVGFLALKTGPYRYFLLLSMRNPLNTLLIFVGFLAFIFAWVATGRIDTNFAPKVESTRIEVEFEMPAGSPFYVLEDSLNHIDEAAGRALSELGGVHYAARRIKEGTGNIGSVTVILVGQDHRPFAAADFVSRWRREVGLMAGPMNVFYDFEVGPGGNKELEIQLSHVDPKVLEDAALKVASAISRLQGVEDIDNGLTPGKPQISFRTTPLADRLGLSAADIGQQLRDAYFGNESIRQIRYGDEIRVRLRRAGADRMSLHSLGKMTILSPDGTEVPLMSVAEPSYGNAYTRITRRDNRRIVTVAGNINRQEANVSLIRKEVAENVMPKLLQAMPGLKWSYGGEAEMEDETNTTILGGTLMCFGAIFAALAGLFRSYLQALIVLSVIPFCIAFAIFGHILMGYSINVISTFGFIALSGLVINGSLVLTMRARENIIGGQTPYDAIRTAAMDRFRPIMLTSLTTSIGLIPILFEVSTQAQFIIPLAIALSFGSFFSIWAILLLTPALLIGLHKLRACLAQLWATLFTHKTSR